MNLSKLLAPATAALVLLAPFDLLARQTDHPVAIAIHAGAGTLKREEMSPERDAEIRATLEKAVRAGHAVLSDGGAGLDAVTAAINILEDSPHFNAGKGAVFNSAGFNELDAAIMDGSDQNAGAVAAVRRIRNPINLARRVMTHSRHVMMIGEGAETFAVEQGFELVDPGYFHTDHRWEQLQKKKAAETAMGEHRESWYSTVGAVVLDGHGNLAAGTSTGGLTNKRWGRVGDTPIVGAGTYANNESCAVSATGTGEYFIRHVVAYSICQRVRQGHSIADAADALIHDVLLKDGGDGGVIAMDAKGNIAMPHNTSGMYRARIDTNGNLFVGIFGDGGDADIPGGEESPYAGQEQREIKSLSPEEVQGYLGGSGMGYAKAAELNHYPGPKHVLELAGELNLSEEQIAQTEAIHAAMQQEAAALGAQLVDRERALDRHFADGEINEDKLLSLVAEIAGLEARIRHAHLAAHLAQKNVLSEPQVRDYDKLRGYGSGHDHARHHH